MSHEKIVALIDRFGEEPDVAKRIALLEEVQKLVAEERERLKAEVKAKGASR